MGHKAILAACSLRQQALDFAGNRDRILESIRISKERGAAFRVGPELEVTGYGCWDHFLEGDTSLHAWQVLADILCDPTTHDILCDIGMPIVHQNVRYNCRVIILNGKILLIRPKMVLADSGNYHESRYFAMWPRFQARLDTHHLPRIIRTIAGQETAPFGEAIIATRDTAIGFEVCEEFFVSNAPHTTMALAGVEVFSNGSASHHELGKFGRKLRLLQSATLRSGGIYLYSNALGCDGDRLFHDGGSLIVANDNFVVGGGLFAVEDVVVVTATVDLEEVRTFRGMMQSMAKQAQYAAVNYPRIVVDFSLSNNPRMFKLLNQTPQSLIVEGEAGGRHSPFSLTRHEKVIIPSVEEELITAPALWLLDYLKRTGSKGFFLPLSGGLDSSSVSLVVYRLAEILSESCGRHCKSTIEFVNNQLQVKDFDTKSICKHLLLTCYMGTSYSSITTKNLAEELANAIGAHHLSLNFDGALSAMIAVIKTVFYGFNPRFISQGGSRNEDLALQNIQARLRMVLGYGIAQLCPITLNRAGPILVLGTSNASETLSGYYTKYDCSSADVNPIGSLDKHQLRTIVKYMAKKHPELCTPLNKILDSIPSAELTPLSPSGITGQTDEMDMGITYDELALLGHLRGALRLGPYSMCAKLNELRPEFSAISNSDLVKRFYTKYAANRHKATSLPPTFHSSMAGPDDNRYDLRPIFYPSEWAEKLGYYNKNV